MKRVVVESFPSVKNYGINSKSISPHYRRLSSPLLLFSHLRVSRRPLPETYTYPEYKCQMLLSLFHQCIQTLFIPLFPQIKMCSHLNVQIEIAISIFSTQAKVNFKQGVVKSFIRKIAVKILRHFMYVKGKCCLFRTSCS